MFFLLIAVLIKGVETREEVFFKKSNPVMQHKVKIECLISYEEKDFSTLSVIEHWRKLPREVVESPVEIIQSHLDCSCITCSGDPALAGSWTRWSPEVLPTPAIPQFSNSNLSWTESVVSWTKRVSSCFWKLNDSSLII